MIKLQSFLSVTLFSISVIAIAQKGNPNVIIIMADDMGYGEIVFRIWQQHLSKKIN